MTFSKGPLQRNSRTLAWVLLVAPIVWVALDRTKAQWDFKVYFAGARALHAGLDPYLAADRHAAAPDVPDPSGDELPLVYAPLTLYLFSPLALLPWPIAYQAWLLLKLAALWALARVVRRHFVDWGRDWWAPFVVLAAFGAPLHADLVSGNPALFAELGLWWAFSRLLTGRRWQFSAALSVVAALKIAPILFAGLPLLLKGRHRALTAAGAVAGFLGLMLLGRALFPHFFDEYQAFAAAVDERGANNPSTLALVKDLVDDLGWPWRPVAAWVSWAAFAAVAAAVLAASAASLRRYRQGTAVADERLLVLFSCTVFALVAPRLKNYGCVVLLPPTLYLLQHCRRRGWVGLLLGISVLPVLATLPVTGTFARYLHGYWVWLGVAVVWWLFRVELLHPARADQPAPAVEAG